MFASPSFVHTNFSNLAHAAAVGSSEISHPWAPSDDRTAPRFIVEPAKKPKRPLSAYNLFFRYERNIILQNTPEKVEGKPLRSHGKIGFASLARTVAAKWKNIDHDTREYFKSLAAEEKREYFHQKGLWQKFKSSKICIPSGEIKDVDNAKTDHVDGPLSLLYSTSCFSFEVSDCDMLHGNADDFSKLSSSLPDSSSLAQWFVDDGDRDLCEPISTFSEKCSSSLEDDLDLAEIRGLWNSANDDCNENNKHKMAEELKSSHSRQGQRYSPTLCNYVSSAA